MGEQMWQPIETAPMDGTDILLSEKGWSRVVLGFRSSTGWFFYDEVIWADTMQEDICTLNKWIDGKGSPTHWMPLPAPPTP